MFDFTIEGSEDVHSIPLAAFLPYPFVHAHIKDDGIMFAMDMLHEFCPELEQDGGLTLETVRAIFKAWNEASRADGADLGE